MNPPLDVPPLHSPAPRGVLAGPVALAPSGVHDLRAARPSRPDDVPAVTRLRYPATAALVFAGVPGAGKSTALLRFFGSGATETRPPTGPGGRVVVDSQHARNRWTPRLRRLPYPLWRPVVQCAHYATIRRALRSASGPVIIHDCGTFRWSRALIARWSRACGRPLHIVMIDVPPPLARAGQRRRGRRSSGLFFALHCKRWAELVGSVTEGRPARVASVVLADRAAINRLSGIDLDA
ncbi:MAG TPA: AAA family ATPase [Nocardia sp.]|nr:AAA family ATPase [Nocardia sp.]HLS79051.1 AAA family ATPase [Nocardia sp.]